jgi:polyisoprenoid-binding protein YceI
LTRTRIIWMGAAVAVLAVAGFGGWYFLLRDDAPPAVSLADAVSSVSSTGTAEPASTASTPEPEPSGSVDPSTLVMPAATDAPAPATDAGLEGDWSVLEGSDSFVGYRVEEELSRIGFTTAVGRTSDVEATVTFDGEAITAIEVEANLQALRSDDDRRDRTLGRQALETNAFPTAAFSLSEPITLAVEPVEGVPIAAVAVGELTLHGVTREVSVALEGQLVGDQVVVVGSAPVVFADYDIDPPSAVIVVSVADNGVFEFQFVLERV